MFKGNYDYSRHSSRSFNYFSETVTESYSPMDMVDKKLLEQRINLVLDKAKEEIERLKGIEDLDKEFNISPERFNLVESPYTEDEIAERLNFWHKLRDFRKDIYPYDSISKILKRELLLGGFSGEDVLDKVLEKVSRLTKTLEGLLDKVSLMSSPSIPFDFKSVEYLTLLQLEEYSKDWDVVYKDMCERLPFRSYYSVESLSDLGLSTSDRDFYTFINGRMYISESLLNEIKEVIEKDTYKEEDGAEKDTPNSSKGGNHSLEYWWDIAAPLALIVGVISFIIYNLV